ncbi:MAG: FIST N-terminal domain-containing protein, partial [Acidobacteriota bacterium]
MKVTKFVYNKNDGWSVDFPTESDSSQTLVFVFGSTSYLENSAPLEELNEKFPHSKIVGCSTAGEIFDSTINDESLSVAVVKFDKTEIETAYSPVFSADESFDSGIKIAQMLNKPMLRGILVLSDGLNVNGSELVRGINSVVSPEVKVTGGLAGDGVHFQKTWVLRNGLPESNIVSAVGFYGEDILIGHGSRGGWDIFGPERKITKSKGNQLFELDGKPALELYKNYLGDLANELPA